LSDDAVNQCGLGEGNGTCVTVAIYGDTEAEMCVSQFRDLPFGTQFSFEISEGLFGTANGEKVVNVNGDEEDTS
jgi:hypothetical protein